jgi:hypothetical protein
MKYQGSAAELNEDRARLTSARTGARDSAPTLNAFTVNSVVAAMVKGFRRIWLSMGSRHCCWRPGVTAGDCADRTTELLLQHQPVNCTINLKAIK